MSEERFRLDARAQASQRRARRITLRVILVVGVLNAASWAVWGTPWRPYDRMFLLLGMAGQLRFHAEGSPPRMSPDSTSFAYALLTQEYSGQPMPLSAWQGPDLHEVSRKFEIYIRDLRPGGTSRLVAAWDLRPKEEAFLASWEPQGLAVTGVFGVRDWGVLVDPRTGARWPILGRVNNWSNRHFVTRHEMVWEEDDPRAPHVELIADRYEAWDPAKRVFTVVAEIPAGRDGYLDPEGAERRRYREEREYADGVQQVSVVHGRVAADSAVIEIVTTARQPAAGSRDYDLLGTIEIPDVARERPFEFAIAQQPLPPERITLGPTSTVIERRFALSKLAHLVDPLRGKTRAIQQPTWRTRFSYTLRPVAVPDDATYHLPPGLVLGLGGEMDGEIDVPLPSNWFPAKPAAYHGPHSAHLTAATRTRP